MVSVIVAKLLSWFADDFAIVSAYISLSYKPLEYGHDMVMWAIFCCIIMFIFFLILVFVLGGRGEVGGERKGVCELCAKNSYFGGFFNSMVECIAYF